jgi:SAM-dependent methyltransferase
MKECSKAVMRRLHDAAFATRYFIGTGLDICGLSDPLVQYRELFPGMKAVRTWDAADGDPQYLPGVADNGFDFVHASFALQRLADPKEALRHWFRVLKPGGHLIVTVPDEDLYEQGHFPSAFSPDHQWSFTIYKARSWSAKSINMVELVQALGAQADVKRMQQLDGGYRHALPRFDQTMTPVAECSIELIVRKRPLDESVAGGRMPRDGQLTAHDVFVLTGLRVEGRKE